MPNIDITLLTSKRHSITVEGYAANVARQQGGYEVVEGENISTEIGVHFPSAYQGWTGYVYMQNSKGEYATHNFGNLATVNQTFDLPSTMTYAGNTRLVIYAVNASTGEKAVWEPVIIPVYETSIDYHKVAQASEDLLQEVAEIASQYEAGNLNGLSCYIVYGNIENDPNFTTTWTAGQSYMGVALARSQPSSPTAYTWSLFTGECTVLDDSAEHTTIDYTLDDDVDKTFSAGGIQNLTIRIPSGIVHGFYAGVNIKNNPNSIQSFTLENNSSYPLVMVLRGHKVDAYTPVAGNIEFMFHCDGLSIMCHILES